MDAGQPIIGRRKLDFSVLSPRFFRIDFGLRIFFKRTSGAAWFALCDIGGLECIVSARGRGSLELGTWCLGADRSGARSACVLHASALHGVTHAFSGWGRCGRVAGARADRLLHGSEYFPACNGGCECE